MVSRLNIERVREVHRSLGRQAAEQVRDLCATAELERQSRAAERAMRRGTGNRTPKCEVCGVFKSRPSDTCPGANCGNHPLQHNCTDEEREAYDRYMGWEEPTAVHA